METATIATTTTKWVLDPTHSELTFKVKHMMITNVKGEFKNFSVEVDGDDIFKSPLKVTVDTSSINTNSEQRDAHLKSADFFDVENHKELTFQSTLFKQKDDGEYLLKVSSPSKVSTKMLLSMLNLVASTQTPGVMKKPAFL